MRYLRRSHGGNANKLIEDYIRRVSVRSVQPDPEHVIYDGARAERQAMATVKKIITDVKLFRETKDPWSFVPANPNSFLCGDQAGASCMRALSFVGHGERNERHPD